MSNIKAHAAHVQAKRLRQVSNWKTRLDPPEAETLKRFPTSRRAINERIAFLERYVGARRPLSKAEQVELDMLRILVL
jgi:hypothetical protein